MHKRVRSVEIVTITKTEWLTVVYVCTFIVKIESPFFWTLSCDVREGAIVFYLKVQSERNINGVPSFFFFPFLRVSTTSSLLSLGWRGGLVCIDIDTQLMWFPTTVLFLLLPNFGLIGIVGCFQLPTCFLYVYVCIYAPHTKNTYFWLCSGYI